MRLFLISQKLPNELSSRLSQKISHQLLLCACASNLWLVWAGISADEYVDISEDISGDIFFDIFF